MSYIDFFSHQFSYKHVPKIIIDKGKNDYDRNIYWLTSSIYPHSPQGYEQFGGQHEEEGKYLNQSAFFSEDELGESNIGI